MTATGKGLLGKIALITGGGSGIARAASQVLAAEGATVVIFDINKNGIVETIASLPKGNHKGYLCDVSSSQDVTESFQQMQDAIGIPSIVICAAGMGKIIPFLDIQEKDLDDYYNIHVKGTFLVMKIAAKALIDAGMKDGRIITFSSALRRGGKEAAHYAAAKAAIAALTRSAAKEWAHIPIRCFAVAPGMTETPLTRALPEELQTGLIKLSALNRYAQPEEIAELCLFLAVQESSFMTGATIEIDGCWDG